MFHHKRVPHVVVSASPARNRNSVAFISGKLRRLMQERQQIETRLETVKLSSFAAHSLTQQLAAVNALISSYSQLRTEVSK